MRAGRADPEPLGPRHAAHVAAQLDELAHHVGGRVAHGCRDLEHRLHQLGIDLRLELVTRDRGEHGVDVLDEVERGAVEQLVFLLDAERVGIALPERVVEHARPRAGRARAALARDVGRDQLLAHPTTASASISTFQDGSSSDATTQVAAGLVSPKTSPWARDDVAPVRRDR